MRGICRLDVAGSRRRGRWLVRDVDLVIHGDGIEEHEDTEWDDQSEYLCTQCESAGKVKVLRSRTNTLGGDTDE